MNTPQKPQPQQKPPKPKYVREQQGHSIMKHVLFGWILLWIPAIYYTISPNHYWHT